MQIPLIRVWVASSTLAQMVKDADFHFPNETGGVFMGYWSSEDEVVITDAIGGGPRAQRSPMKFLPDAEFQLAGIEEIYRASRSSRSYLGDWHTHPRGNLSLSPTDRATLKRIAGTAAARAKSPIMMLLAGGDEWTAAAWCWRSHTRLWGTLHSCELVIHDR